MPATALAALSQLGDHAPLLVRATGAIPIPAATPGPVVGGKPPCYQVQDTICQWVSQQTGQKWLGVAADWFLAKPLSILLIVVVAIVVRWLLLKAITRLARRAAEGTVPGVLQRGAVSILDQPLLSARRRQRAETMGSVLRSITTGVVASIAFVMILSELDVNVAPILASAGILGVALGFGSQSLVKDFLSGIFMILEDQYGVGDAVDAGDASGTVEAVGLRVTRLRDVNGTVWYLPNGEIRRIGNMSQGWSRAVVDVNVAYGEDVATVRSLLLQTARGIAEDADWKSVVLEEPEVWGVESLGRDAVTVRVVIKTVPLQQWAVARELRERIKATLEEHGVELPFPQRTVWIRTPGEPEDEARTPSAAPPPSSPSSTAPSSSPPSSTSSSSTSSSSTSSSSPSSSSPSSSSSSGSASGGTGASGSGRGPQAGPAHPTG